MEEENINSKMEAITKDNGKIIKLMVLVNFIFLVKSYNTLDNGTMMNLVDGELNFHRKDRTGKSMKESFRME